MSIDHGELLAAYSEFFDAVMKDNATGESQRRRCAARDKVLELRAIAQPAEAVEGGDGLIALAKLIREEFAKIRTHLSRINAQQPAEAVEGADGDSEHAEEVAKILANRGFHAASATVRRLVKKHDAAQGAVARVAWRSDPDQGTYLVAEWLGPLPEPGELLFTHPQAAPAQGDGEEDRCGWCGRARSSDPLSHDPHCRVRTHPHSDWAKRELSRGATPSPEPR